MSQPERRRLRGIDVLHDPRVNKGTAFTAEERDALGLRGLLPARVVLAAEQMERVLRNLEAEATPLERYIFLTALQDRNETLFYRVLVENITRMMPIVYTPTVGEACRRFGHIFRRPRGLYVSIEDRGRVAELIGNWPEEKVSIVVVTDGERILGLGDLGAHGMGIPIGKLSLYTACAGVPPNECLPVLLDVGTENAELLADPLYTGLPRRRARGDEYVALVEEFVTAVRARYPSVLIQWEDFATENAFTLLERYRRRVTSFNDDIQGTAAVTLAGILGAARITGAPLTEQRILFLGAGSAATGVADLIVAAMRGQGLSDAEARGRCWFVDSKGLVVESRAGLARHKLPYAHEHAPIATLAEAIEALQPTALMGLSAQPGAFDEGIIRGMARANQRPMIFALSNPTSKAECSAEAAYRWSEGRAVFASGSPFDPVELDGKRFVPGQGNNAYIFPGLGLGVILSQSREVTDSMFLAAAWTLAEMVGDDSIAAGTVYPALDRIREVSARIATAVIEVARAEELCGREPPPDIEGFVRGSMYQPAYGRVGG
ncbi:MAG: NAD-dependent malic enzyme [Gemmatimonadales bacterium]